MKTYKGTAIRRIERAETPGYLRNLFFAGAVAGIVFLASSTIRNYFDSLDSSLDVFFAPDRWKKVEFHNPETGFYKFYSAEGVPKSTLLYHRYLEEVRNRNTIGRQGYTPDGMINLPDLDGDGKVGEEELRGRNR